MQIILNGTPKETSATTIEALIREVGVEGKVMAAAINMEVIKQENWPTAPIQAGDKVELLQFVGGG
jgi:sulfur carrier protein